MADSKKPKERAQQADKELRAKLRHEKPLASDMEDLFEDMAADLQSVYSSSGTVIDPTEYNDEILGLLRRSYRSVSAEFGSILEDDLLRVKDDVNNILGHALRLQAERGGLTTDDVIADYIATKNAGIVDFIGMAVPARTAMIQATNKAALSEAVEKAMVNAIQTFGGDFNASTTLGRRQVAQIAHDVFLESNAYRAKVIAATEVQNAAEGSKKIASTSLDETLKPVMSSSAVMIHQTKEWHTRGDDKVRPAHVAADLQTQPALSPFSVGGERMMEPGDSSMGASAGNTINCRCSAVYYYEGERPAL